MSGLLPYTTFLSGLVLLCKIESYIILKSRNVQLLQEYYKIRNCKGADALDTVALVLAVILFIMGLIGTVLPVLPGVLLIYAGMVLYGVLTGFAGLDTMFFILQGMAVVLVFSLDYLATAAGSRRFGGSKYAAWGAALGTLLGILLLGPFGILVGPFLGAVTAEIIRGKDPQQAVRIGFGTLVGLLGGTILKLGIEGLMIVWFFLSI